MAEKNQSVDDVSSAVRTGARFAMAIGSMLLMLFIVVGILLAWPYVAGASVRRHSVVTTLTPSTTLLLPPPAHCSLEPY